MIISLEMTSPDQLVPGRPPPLPIDLEEVTEASIVRATYRRIGGALGWSGRMTWTEAQWREELSRAGVRAWIPRVSGEVAGLVELEAEPSGDVGIVVFGLEPEFVGRGFGGTFLTLVTKLAWKLPTPNGAAKRVWLQTHSGDHPHALPNYKARGFRVFRTEET